MADATHFGSRQVPLEDKQALVDDVFRSVARRYDLMNDLMSLGLHRAWKDALITALDPPKSQPFALLDLAGGTGDIAFRALQAGGELTLATVCDINPDMLAVGRERAAASAPARSSRSRRDTIANRITFAEANAEALPFADKSFDAVTIAFGIRNVPRIDVGARGGIPRAQARRQIPLSRIFGRRYSRPRPAVRVSIRSTSSPRSAAWWRAMPSPTAIWSNRSAASRDPKPSPPCCARPALPGCPISR